LTDWSWNAEAWARFERQRRLRATVEYMGEPLPERTLWPIRPWPMPDELLSSWLNRVAVANGMAPRPFYLSLARAVGWKSVIVRSYTLATDLKIESKETSWVDLRCANRLADYLAQRTGMPRRLIQGLALERPRDVPEDVMVGAGTLQWDLIEAVPDILASDNEDSAYMRFCPYCLMEWDDSWYRKLWRTSLATVCIRHASRLLFKCACGRNVRPHLSKAVRSQVFCYSCGHDLRTLDAKPASPNEMKHQKEMNWRAYQETEAILRNGCPRDLLKQLIDKPTDYILEIKARSLPLLRTGLIDAYNPNSALSLWMIYRDIRHGNPS
jgi:TniQ protein